MAFVAKDEKHNEPLVQEKMRAGKQRGLSEAGALKHALGGHVAPAGGVSGGGSPKAFGEHQNPAGGSSAPKGMRLSSLEIRPAVSGAIVRHSYEREPGVTAGKAGPQEPDLMTMNPQEHAFSSTQEAMNHLNQHVGSLFNRKKA